MIRVIIEIDEESSEFSHTFRRIEDMIRDNNATSFDPIQYKMKAELVEDRITVGDWP